MKNYKEQRVFLKQRIQIIAVSGAFPEYFDNYGQ